MIPLVKTDNFHMTRVYFIESKQSAQNGQTHSNKLPTNYRQITDELFECVLSFCETGALRVKCSIATAN